MNNLKLSLLLLTLTALFAAQPAEAQDLEQQGLANRMSVLISDFYAAEQYQSADGVDALTTDDFVEERIDGRGTQKMTKPDLLSELRRSQPEGLKKLLARLEVKRQSDVFSTAESSDQVDFKFKLTEFSSLKIDDAAPPQELKKTERFDGNGIAVRRNGKWQLARLQRTLFKNPNKQQLINEVDESFNFEAALLPLIADAIKPESLTVAPDNKSKATDEPAVLALVNAYHNALVKEDTAALERVLADEFFDPQFGSKQLIINYFKLNAHSPKVTRFTAIDVIAPPRIRIYNDAATIWGVASVATREGGKDKSQSYYVTLTAVRQQGIWQIVMSHQSEFNAQVSNPLWDNWQLQSFGATDKQRPVEKDVSIKFTATTFSLTVGDCDPINYEYTFDGYKINAKPSSIVTKSCPRAKDYQKLVEGLKKVYEFKFDNGQLELTYDPGKVIRFTRARSETQPK